jgi:hypothetical protein
VVGPSQVLGEDDLPVGHLFDDLQSSGCIEVGRSILVNCSDDLGKACEASLLHPVRLRARPVSWTIEDCGVDRLNLSLGHGKCRQVGALIAVDQRGVQIKLC